MGDAFKKIMGDSRIPAPDKNKYLQRWREAKATGKLPAASTGEVVKADMSLSAVLALMERKAAQAEADGIIAKKYGKAISGLAGRKLWVVPADQTPSCKTIPEGDAEAVDVRFMARLEIPLC